MFLWGCFAGGQEGVLSSSVLLRGSRIGGLFWTVLSTWGIDVRALDTLLLWPCRAGELQVGGCEWPRVLNQVQVRARHVPYPLYRQSDLIEHFQEAPDQI